MAQLAEPLSMLVRLKEVLAPMSFMDSAKSSWLEFLRSTLANAPPPPPPAANDMELPEASDPRLALERLTPAKSSLTKQTTWCLLVIWVGRARGGGLVEGRGETL